MTCGSTTINIFIFLSLILNIILTNGQHRTNEKCDENTVNMHMLQCYKQYIDDQFDLTSPENAYFMEGSLLCQAYNKSSSYRQCLYSIFDVDEICSRDHYPYSYEYSKIYWKLVISSCQVSKNGNCHPSRLSQQILSKCHYSFDDKYPTKCTEFLRSVKCMEQHEVDLIPSTYGSQCSTNKAFYYYYGDLAARLQLAINICE
ncbi:unnamed protein product [Rotaria sordida]|uniref:Uncharacterized protein n=2 Tax=Rotaria sordida TaxID=392033 RepID=A0A815D365_9BILA|nr:unnamed protein product [Rotaria sordida]CAF1194401.1 unnamed protein product [Rotaria sordida]CAF1226808.1 unnamed protein product [Rotaria sordida]CAF1292272.1 unnamed protein product [Rotaria sordida]CAF1311406.1 unnamed protein product [Rotaria sordida]